MAGYLVVHLVQLKVEMKAAETVEMKVLMLVEMSVGTKVEKMVYLKAALMVVLKAAQTVELSERNLAATTVDWKAESWELMKAD